MMTRHALPQRCRTYVPLPSYADKECEWKCLFLLSFRNRHWGSGGLPLVNTMIWCLLKRLNGNTGTHPLRWANEWEGLPSTLISARKAENAEQDLGITSEEEDHSGIRRGLSQQSMRSQVRCGRLRSSTVVAERFVSCQCSHICGSIHSNPGTGNSLTFGIGEGIASEVHHGEGRHV